MTTEQLGALRMRRDVLARDLNAVTRGEAGSHLTTAETSFYQSRLGALDNFLVKPAALHAKARR